jgi:hypothetical protein
MYFFSIPDLLRFLDLKIAQDFDLMILPGAVEVLLQPAE